MAFSFELKLAISSELYGAISAGPEQGSSLRKGGAGAAGRRPPLWGSAAAEYGCLMTGQENERGAPRHL